MNNKVYAIMYCWCADGDTDTEILEICDSEEKAKACLKLQAEYNWADWWEFLNLDRDDFEEYEWSDDYYDVVHCDMRTTIYIVEKEIK